MKYVLIKHLPALDKYLSQGPYNDLSSNEVIGYVADGYKVYEVGNEVPVVYTPAKVEVV